MSSALPSDASDHRQARRRRLAAVATAVAVLAVHLATLSPVLDDIDAVNFALGVRAFDPTLHQPHPPGYPLYVALGRLSTSLFDAARPVTDRAAAGIAAQRNAAQGLAVWSALSAALSLWPIAWLFGRIERRAGPPPQWWSGTATPWVAAGIAITSPLFWFSASRPLTDVPGLVTSTAIQVALLALASAPVSGRDGSVSSRPARLLAAASFAAAAAIGLRSQSMWLTLPLLAVVVLRLIRFRAWRLALIAAVAFVAGALTWAVPVAVASGGIGPYLAALGDQGAADFAGVDMWYRNPTPRRMAVGLYQTFVLPWDAWPLASLVLALAAAGAIASWRHRRGSLGWLALLFGPYALFHLVFHETATTRYALPLVAPTAYLATIGARWIGRRGWGILGAAIVAAGLSLATPVLVRAATAGTPFTTVIARMSARIPTLPSKPILALHYQSERALAWMSGAGAFWEDRLAAPPYFEWRELVTYWLQGGQAPVWFLANPKRTDLALVDPRARRLVLAARWPFRAEVYAGRARPDEVDWYEIESPGWFAGEGWSLTPETAGVASASGRGPSLAPIDAWARRRGGATTLLVGGRNLGPPGAPRARVRVRVDGRIVSVADVDPAPGFFLNMVALPPGSLAGEGALARITIGAEAARSGAPVPPVAIEQFDLQDEGELVCGYGDGWHEMEYDPATGRRWRWTSRRAALVVHPVGRDAVLRLSGENPRRYFPRSARLEVSAGATVLARFELSRDFDVEVAVPAEALAAAGGSITLSTSEAFVPDQRSHNGDRRLLGLRIYSARLDAR